MKVGGEDDDGVVKLWNVFVWIFLMGHDDVQGQRFDN